MSCSKCRNLQDIDDLSRPYVVRKCGACGREVKLRDITSNGHGIRVVKGDRFVFPPGFFQISANPLKANSHLTKPGLSWYAQLIFVEELQQNPDNTSEFLSKNDEYSSTILKKSRFLKDLDLEDKAQANEAIERLKDHKDKIEWWALLFGTFNKMTEDAIAENDAEKAAWAMRIAERCRAMCVFKDSLEEVVWMGHSAGRIIEVIKKWHSNMENNNEEFWQVIFNDNPYVLSQIFSVPVMFIKGKAYVGGMNIDGQNAKFVDYLFANESSNDAMLVEIKTPETQLMAKTNYRKGIYNPTKDLSGSILQVLNYRRELTKNLHSITSEIKHRIEMFNPRCIVIIGNAEKELKNELKRKSFELFRTNLKDVEIITFDELFRKAEILASLFNLSWEQKKD